LVAAASPTTASLSGCVRRSNKATSASCRREKASAIKIKGIFGTTRYPYGKSAYVKNMQFVVKPNDL
jgi:archaellin